jgi:hypothetical protein
MVRAHLLCLLLAPALAGHLRAQAPQRYTSFTEHFAAEGWLRASERSLSPEGYILHEGRYHPVTVATGGILAYERFLDTGDSAWFHLMRDQVRYFTDTARTDRRADGQGTAIPYDWDFGRHKAPWYSGMAQGVALSLLLRHEHLTGDTSLAPLMRRIAWFMVLPEEQGGCRSTTMEGMTWIEEYPHSAEHRHVLNGFLNALVGLIEYGRRFPDDSLACAVRDSCFASLRRCWDHYDRTEWSAYDRSGGGLTAGYLQYQIVQLQHLVELTGDPLLRDQMRLWTVYATDRPNNEKRSYMRRRGWQASARLVAQDSASLRPDVRAADPEKRRTAHWTTGPPGRAGGKGRASTAAKSQWTVHHTLPSALPVELLEIARDTLPWPLEVEVATRDTLQRRFRRLSAQPMKAAVDRISIRVPRTRMKDLRIRITAPGTAMPDTARMLLRLGLPGANLAPWTAFERIGPVKVVPERPYRVQVHPDHAADATVFYRTGRDIKAIRSTPWRARNTVGQGRVVVTDRPFIELLVVHPLRTPDTVYRPTRLEAATAE